MSPLDLLRFSGGALRGHRLRTSLSLLGVAIGVASVILLTSLGEGARLYVTGEFEALGTNLLIILPGKTETTGVAPIFGGVPHDLTVEDAEAVLKRVPQVRRVAPLSLGTAPARFGERSRDVAVAGTTNDFLHVRKVPIAMGRYVPAGNPDQIPKVCVIGWRLREELFPGTNPLGEILRIGDERFRVIGVMARRGESLGQNLDELVHVPVKQELRMFNQTSLFRLILEVGAHQDMEAARRAVLQVLKERHDGVEDVTIFTQDAVLATFGKIFAILTAALAGIAGISLSVAGIGIMNVMLVSVSERTGEIGLLKAVGVTPAQVLAAFLAEAAILSTAGGLLGLGSGLGAARLFEAIYPSFPVQPPPWAVAAALLVSFSVGLLFGALPARRAARLDPIAALALRG
jgi:putative ABC transport system permease protein